MCGDHWDPTLLWCLLCGLNWVGVVSSVFYLEQAALGLSLSLTPFHDAHGNEVEAKPTVLSLQAWAGRSHFRGSRNTVEYWTVVNGRALVWLQMVQGERSQVYAWFAPSVDGSGQKEAGREMVWTVKDSGCNWRLLAFITSWGQWTGSYSVKALVGRLVSLSTAFTVLWLGCREAKLQETSG